MPEQAESPLVPPERQAERPAKQEAEPRQAQPSAQQEAPELSPQHSEWAPQQPVPGGPQAAYARRALPRPSPRLLP